MNIMFVLLHIFKDLFHFQSKSFYQKHCIKADKISFMLKVTCDLQSVPVIKNLEKL